jgi:hypothetical protein
MKKLLLCISLWWSAALTAADSVAMLPNTSSTIASQIETLSQECMAFGQEFGQYEKEIPNVEKELQELVKTLSTTDAGFKNKLLATTPDIKLFTEKNFPTIKLGLYGADVLNIGFWFAEYGIDWFLFKELKAYSVEHLTDKFLEKHEQLLKLFDEIKHNEKDNSIVSDKNSKALYNFFQNECFVDLHLRKILTSRAMLKIIGCLLGYECLNYAKNIALPPSPNLLTAQGLRYAINPETAKEQPSYIISASTIIQFFSYLFLGISPITSTLLSLGDGLASISRVLGYRPYVFDSYFFQLCKRLFIMVYFSRQLNALYKGTWVTFIQKHADELQSLLDDYKKAKDQKEQEKIDLIKKELITIVMQGHTYSFFWWIRFKNVAFFRTNTLIETMLSLPLLYRAGRFVLSFIV